MSGLGVILLQSVDDLLKEALKPQLPSNEVLSVKMSSGRLRFVAINIDVGRGDSFASSRHTSTNDLDLWKVLLHTVVVHIVGHLLMGHAAIAGNTLAEDGWEEGRSWIGEEGGDGEVLDRHL